MQLKTLVTIMVLGHISATNSTTAHTLFSLLATTPPAILIPAQARLTRVVYSAWYDPIQKKTSQK